MNPLPHLRYPHIEPMPAPYTIRRLVFHVLATIVIGGLLAVMVAL